MCTVQYLNDVWGGQFSLAEQYYIFDILCVANNKYISCMYKVQDYIWGLVFTHLHDRRITLKGDVRAKNKSFILPRLDTKVWKSDYLYSMCV